MNLKTQPRLFYGYIVVAISFLIFMVILGLISSFGIFFKPLMEEMGWTRTVTSGAFSLNVMVGGIAGIIAGILNDRFGPRIVLTLHGLFSVIGYFFISQMHSLWQFYLFFGLIVGSGSNVYVPTLSTVARWFVQRRSLMSGIAFAGAGFGMVVFPPVINRFMALYDWRTSLMIMSIIILIVSILSAILLRSDPRELGLVPYGAGRFENEGSHFESRSFSFKEAASTRQFWILFLIMFCYGFCFFSIQVHIAPYATDVGISSAGAAAILSVIGGAMIIGQIGLGSLGDKFGYKKTFLLGMIFIVFAILILMLGNKFWVFLVFAALAGAAFGDCSTQESSIVAWLFGLDSHGTMLGFFAFSFTIGACIGPVLFGYIFDATGSYQYSFLIAEILSVAAVILTVFLKQSITKAETKTED